MEGFFRFAFPHFGEGWSAVTGLWMFFRQVCKKRCVFVALGVLQPAQVVQKCDPGLEAAIAVKSRLIWIYGHALRSSPPPSPPKGQWSGYRVGRPPPLWCGVCGPSSPCGVVVRFRGLGFSLSF